MSNEITKSKYTRNTKWEKDFCRIRISYFLRDRKDKNSDEFFDEFVMLGFNWTVLYIAVYEVATKLGVRAKALMLSHAITGCDTVF